MAQVKQVLDWMETRIVTAPVENAVIITRTGDIYHCTGSLNSLDTIVELGEKLYGAIVTHNHPKDSDNEYSFSESDWYIFRDFKLALLHGIDEKFLYEFNRNVSDLDRNNFTYEDLMSDKEGVWVRHINVIKLAIENKIGYRRWLR